MITLLQLDYFRRLAASEHITATARELYISQTALSNMLSGLEKELGVRLFDRVGRSIRLNEAGRIYLEHVNRAFASLENGRAAVEELSQRKGRQISIAMASTQVWLPLLRAFHTACPDLALRQFTYSARELSQALADMTVDFVLAGEAEITGEDLEKTLIREESVCLCVPAGHPLAGRESLYLREVRDEPFISLTEDSPWRVFCDRMLEEAGVRVHTAVECDYTLRGPLVESGFGVALTSSAAREVDLLRPNRYIRVADLCARRSIYLFRNPRRFLSSAAESFRQFCLDFFRGQREPSA
jgi:DNA-binding transcriptional LysR family regulator